MDTFDSDTFYLSFSRDKNVLFFYLKFVWSQVINFFPTKCQKYRKLGMKTRKVNMDMFMLCLVQVKLCLISILFFLRYNCSRYGWKNVWICYVWISKSWISWTGWRNYSSWRRYGYHSGKEPTYKIWSRKFV